MNKKIIIVALLSLSALSFASSWYGPDRNKTVSIESVANALDSWYGPERNKMVPIEPTTNVLDSWYGPDRNKW